MKKSSVIEKIQCRRKKNDKIEKNFETNSKTFIEKNIIHDRINKNRKSMQRKKKQSKKHDSSTSKSYEKIDFEKKFDEKKSPDAYFYIITSNSSKVCKKCDIKKKYLFSTINFMNTFGTASKMSKKKRFRKKKFRIYRSSNISHSQR